jgi:predicted nuclease of predicted toxin-antitoxin system
MRLKVDENLHDDVAERLAAEDHDVHTVPAEGLRGANDLTLAQHCMNEGRALITLDLGFADIRTYPPSTHAGLIVLRLGNQSRRHALTVMARVAEVLKREPINGRLWIVTEAGVRIRG